MKFRNFIIVLLAVLTAFSFASCKNEPSVTPPEPTPQVDPMELYPYKDYTPTSNEIQVIRITEGVETDYWNRDKLKIEWEEPVEAGDTITLKYRSEREIYQWDIRDGSTKWVYESSKNNFVDPVVGAGGWYSFSYTFADVDINGTELLSNSRFGIYFRGNFVEDDVFEIMDVRLNGEPLDIEQANIKSAAVLDEEPIMDHVWEIPRNYAVLLATGKVGEVDKHPLIAKVAPGSTAEELAEELEEDGGYIVELFSDSDKTTPYDLKTKILKDAVIVYYNRTGVERTVKFNLNGGSASPAIGDVTVRNGQSVSEPATKPTKDGMLFAEWCTDAEGTKVYDFSKAITGDLTLYARYGVPRTVTFDLNGAEGTIEPALVADGMTVARPTPEPANGPYGLEDWYLGTEVYDFTTPVTSDITLRAEWSDKAVITVNLNYEGAQTKTFKAALDAPLSEDNENLEVALRPGFVFEGWFDDAACTQAHNFTANVTGPFTLYAKWTDGTIYKTIAKNGDGGSTYDKFILDWQDGTVKVEKGDTLAFAYRTTVDFQKFNIRDNETTIDAQKNKWIYESGPETLTSHVEGTDGWIYVTYTFSEKFASGNTPNEGSDVTYPAVFRFDFISKNIKPGDILEVKGITLNGEEIPLLKVDACSTAFESISEFDDWTVTHNVTFNYGEGDERTYTDVDDFATLVTLPTDTEKEGATFLGWYTDAEFTEKFNDSVKQTEDIVLYGCWVTPVKLTIHDGDKSVEKEIAKGSTISASDIRGFGKVGFYVKWYADADLSAEFDFDSAINDETDIYAKWVAPEKSYVFTAKDNAETKDRFQWVWAASELPVDNLKAGDTITFMVRSTPKAEESALTNFRLRNGAESDIGYKYVDFPAADAEGWHYVTITFEDDKVGSGLVLGLYAAEHGKLVKAGDICEIRAVAFNGIEVPVKAMSYSIDADMTTVDLVE